MAESKVDVLMRVSEVNLARAEKRFDIGEYDSAVFHASVAVESAANAMIIRLGGNEAKNHRAVSGLAAVLRRVKPELSREEKYVQLIKRGRESQRDYRQRQVCGRRNKDVPQKSNGLEDSEKRLVS